jgi:hypothetical protein
VFEEEWGGEGYVLRLLPVSGSPLKRRWEEWLGRGVEGLLDCGLMCGYEQGISGLQRAMGTLPLPPRHPGRNFFPSIQTDTAIRS